MEVARLKIRLTGSSILTSNQTACACFVAGLLVTAGCASALYKPATATRPIRTLPEATVTFSGNSQPLRLRIVYPDAPGRYPLIIFSHGASCSNRGYEILVEYWAHQGYVVILPNHPDAGQLDGLSRDTMEKIFRIRLAEMSQIIVGLERIEVSYPELAGKIDHDRIAAAGHSMGALTAAVVSGLQLIGTGVARNSFREPGVRIALLLSGPGPLPNIAEDGWTGLTLPLLVTTGTKDQAKMAGPDATWEWRLSSYALTPARNKFALVVQNADHFLAGVICPEQANDLSYDSEALAILQSVSGAFLDAYLKNDSDARNFMTDEPLEKLTHGRAELRRR